MAKVLDVIWGKWEQKYFSENQKNSLTRPSTNRPTGKSLEPVLLSSLFIFASTEAAKLQWRPGRMG
jgi:hypothetical protein